MKIALYIEDGLEQIVLTPETSVEKSILASLHNKTRVFEMKKGEFYACQGGWTRHADRGDESTMIVMRPKPPGEPVEWSDHLKEPKANEAEATEL